MYGNQQQTGFMSSSAPFALQAFRRASRLRERLWIFVAGVVVGNVGTLVIAMAWAGRP